MHEHWHVNVFLCEVGTAKFTLTHTDACNQSPLIQFFCKVFIVIPWGFFAYIACSQTHTITNAHTQLNIWRLGSRNALLLFFLCSNEEGDKATTHTDTKYDEERFRQNSHLSCCWRALCRAAVQLYFGAQFLEDSLLWTKCVQVTHS